MQQRKLVTLNEIARIAGTTKQGYQRGVESATYPPGVLDGRTGKILHDPAELKAWPGQYQPKKVSK